MKYILLIVISTSFLSTIKAQNNDLKNENAMHPPAFKFHLPDTSGRIYSNNDFKGKIVIMDFWYTGCGPCRGFAKILHKFADSLNKTRKDIVFVSVNSDKNKEDWKRSVQSGMYTYDGEINLNAPPFGEELQSEIEKYYRSPGNPFVVVMDKNGGVISYALARYYIKDGNISKSAMMYLILRDN